MTSSTIYRHPDLCLHHGAILCPTAAPVIRPLKPFLPSLPLLRLGIGEREPARALVGAGAAADTRLLAGEHETPQPEAGQERTTRESQHEARLPRASVPRPTVERRCSVVERRDEQDGLREWRRLVSRCYHICHCKPKSTHGNRPRIGIVGLQGGEGRTLNKGGQRQAARQDYSHETERELRQPQRAREVGRNRGLRGAHGRAARVERQQPRDSLWPEYEGKRLQQVPAARGEAVGGDGLIRSSASRSFIYLPQADMWRRGRMVLFTSISKVLGRIGGW